MNHAPYHTAMEAAPERRSEEEPFRFRVVVAGAGFAGVYCAQALGRALGHRRGSKEVALISARNTMEFQPMLPEVCGSEVSPRHVVNPIRRLCREVTVMRGRIVKIDLPARRLTLNAGPYSGNRVVEFEHLALSIGSVVDLSRVPGMPEHAYLIGNVGDAMALRGAIIDRFEEATLAAKRESVRRLLTFVVVGGGYSGVETAGQIADLAADVSHLYPKLSLEDIRVVLVHSGPHLLPEIGERLGRYAESELGKRRVEVILNTRVSAMTASKVYFKWGGSLESFTVVSTVGIAPHPLVTQLCQENGIETVKGRIITEATLRVPGHPCLWSAGDCASIPLPDGRKAPPTAQFAVREGRLMGGNLARVLNGAAPRPFDYKGVGELANIGRRTAVADIFGLQFSGFFAWWLWRTVYLAKLPGLDRKLRVVIDWTLDLFFPRDISLLNPQGKRLVQEMHLEAKDRLFQAGEPALSFYFVRSGSVELRDENGELRRTIREGEHFGERALLTDRVWRFDAFATGPSDVVALDADLFDQLQACRAFHEVVERSAGAPPPSKAP